MCNKRDGEGFFSQLPASPTELGRDSVRRHIWCLGSQATGTGPDRCRAFTLLEALMACGILLGVVVSVTSAITAGQQNAFEAHQRIAACLAADDLMGRVLIQDYTALPSWNGHTEAVGAMTDMKGNLLPESQNTVGRVVRVTTDLVDVGDLNIRVRGRTVVVRAFNSEGRTLAALTRFVPEPGP